MRRSGVAESAARTALQDASLKLWLDEISNDVELEISRQCGRWEPRLEKDDSSGRACDRQRIAGLREERGRWEAPNVARLEGFLRGARTARVIGGSR